MLFGPKAAFTYRNEYWLSLLYITVVDLDGVSEIIITENSKLDRFYWKGIGRSFHDNAILVQKKLQNIVGNQGDDMAVKKPS